MVFAEAEPEEIVERLAGAFGGAIEQREVEGALHGEGNFRDALEKLHAAGDVGEGKPGGIELGEDGQDGLDGLAVEGRRGGFADGRDTSGIGHFHYHSPVDARSFAAGNFPRVSELELARAGADFHQQIQADFDGFENE